MERSTIEYQVNDKLISPYRNFLVYGLNLGLEQECED